MGVNPLEGWWARGHFGRYRVLSKRNCQQASNRNPRGKRQIRATGQKRVFWTRFAHQSRRAKAASKVLAVVCQAVSHWISPRDQESNSGKASSADSKAMDMPFPVNGGIMVTVSTMQNSPE